MARQRGPVRNAQHEVAGGAGVRASRTRQAGGEAAAEGRAASEMRRFEGEHLAVRVEQGLDFREWRAGARGQHEFLRLVVGDAREGAGAEHFALVRVAVEGLAAAAAQDERHALVVRRADAFDETGKQQNLGSSGCGNWPA